MGNRNRYKVKVIKSWVPYPNIFYCLFVYIFFPYINLLAGYYRKNKKRLQNKLLKGIKIYQRTKKKNKKRQCACERYKILPEDEARVE